MKLNQRTKTFFAISIAAVFSLSVIAMSEMPQAIAANDKGSKPDFASSECIITGFGQKYLSGDVDCQIQAWLDNGKHLRYKYIISGMELSDTNSDSSDDIDGIHIHKANPPEIDPANPKGPHVLNVFGHPGVDDRSAVAIPKLGMIMGVWDDKDENLSYGEPDNSHKFTENLELLCNGQIFTAVHGTEEDVPGHNAPYLKMVLEPTANGIKACEKILD